MMANTKDIIPRVRFRRKRQPSDPIFIRKISIRGLFGQIDYNDLNLDGRDDAERLSVLFGDNGAGKTTLLHLIYSTLSPENGVGLRGYIARTPFTIFQIYFSNGTCVEVSKLNGLTGSYRYRQISDIPEIDVKIIAEEDNRVSPQDSVITLEKFLGKLGIDVLFVDHERYIRSTYSFLSDLSSEDQSEWSEVVYRAKILTLGGDAARRGREKSMQFPLSGMVSAVDQMFRNQAFQQGSVGEQNASAVYLEIAKALIRPKKRGRPSPEIEKKDLIEVLDDLERRTASFVKHGLLSNYPFADLKNTFNAAPKSKKMNIADALTPFVTSIERRLSTLDSLHGLLTLFEKELNNYLANKTASVHVLHGLIIRDGNGVIQLAELSSGEKQLVFLLCAAVVSRGSRSLILIDEPELSLNYKWQRLIAGSLAKLSSPQTTQFIMASHSIEIISRYSSSAVELKNDAPQAIN